MILFINFARQTLRFSMLQHIRVKNYAIIDEVSIDFNPHFNIITGETGAGKSILLGALGLILGNRADNKIFYNSSEKCIIEAEFEIGTYGLQSWFADNDLDYESPTLIRREIQPAGKNRVFINDTPVTLVQLQEFTGQLVDIHQQFSLYDIQKPAYQLTLFDAFCGNKALVIEYNQSYRKYTSLTKELASLEEARLQSIKEKDYIEFQLNELSSIPLDTFDQDALEGELNLIEHAEAIKSTTGATYLALYEDERSIVSGLEDILNGFKSISGITPGLQELYDRILSSKIELRELADEINQLADNTHIEEERALEIRDALDQLYKLQSKHQVSSVHDLVQLKLNLEGKLQHFSSVDNDIRKVKSEIDQYNTKLQTQADLLSAERHKHVEPFVATLTHLLNELGMPHATFVVEINAAEQLTPSGKDHVQFLFSANKGKNPSPIKDVASGGEISRLTLSIKSMVAAVIPLPSLIFDEVDTGLGGEIALKMAEIMQQMSVGHQLIAITHSPQLASKADKHLYVYKEIEEDKTITQIKELSLDERIETIAIMLSTKPPSKAAIENAKELLNR